MDRILIFRKKNLKIIDFLKQITAVFILANV